MKKTKKEKELGWNVCCWTGKGGRAEDKRPTGQGVWCCRQLAELYRYAMTSSPFDWLPAFSFSRKWLLPFWFLVSINIHLLMLVLIFPSAGLDSVKCCSYTCRLARPTSLVTHIHVNHDPLIAVRLQEFVRLHVNYRDLKQKQLFELVVLLLIIITSSSTAGNRASIILVNSILRLVFTLNHVPALQLLFFFFFT